MIQYKRLFLVFITFSLIGCGKNNETEEHQLKQSKEPNYEQKSTIDNKTEKKENPIFDTAKNKAIAIQEV